MLDSENRIGANLTGLLVMAVAAPSVLLLVVGLNRLSKPKEETASAREVSFSVEVPKPKPPPERKEEPPRRPPPRRSGSSDRIGLSRLAALGPGLSGVKLDLPEFRLETGAVSDRVLGDLGDVVHTEATVDRKPSLRFKVPIDAPPEARRRNLAGRVVVTLLVGVDGVVKVVRVTESDPPGVFDACVVQSVREWRFEPAIYKSQPVEMWVSLPVQFSP
jgi:TonB family protein